MGVFSHHCPLFSVFSSSHSQHFLCGVNPDSPGCKWFDFFFVCVYFRVKLLWGQKKKQLEDLNYCREER